MSRLLMGVDVGLGSGKTCYAVIKEDGVRLTRVSVGRVTHNLGKSNWIAKRRLIIDSMKEVFRDEGPDVVLIEKPPYGDRGACKAAVVAVAAVLDLAWSIAWAAKDVVPEVYVVLPDNKTKVRRHRMLLMSVADWPKRTTADERDAGWIAISNDPSRLIV